MLVMAGSVRGTANALYLYANLMATGVETGHPVAYPGFARFGASFEGTARDPLCRFPARRPPLGGCRLTRRVARAATSRAIALALRHPRALGFAVIQLEEGEECVLDDPEVAARLRSSQRWLFTGWIFRNVSAVTRHADLIRSHLAPRADHRLRAQSAVGRAREGADRLVGLHVRRQDYRDFQGGRFFFPIEEYGRVAQAVRAALAPARVHFLVCSDEADVTARLKLPGAFPGPGDAVDDLHALSSCDLIVGPPSTFSMWASFAGSVPVFKMWGGGGFSLDACETPLPVPWLETGR